MKKQLLILALAATLINALAGCTTASKARVYHDGKTFGRSVLRAGGQLAADAFNQWLEEQK
jgi:outer membrane protein assembly factor BamE (lipoprotein component of BamABCDE complex)